MSLPVIAPQPSVPINLDAGYTYDYVIASSGETALAAGFTAGLSVGLNAGTRLLTVKCTDALGVGESRDYIVNVSAYNSSGRTSYDISFRATNLGGFARIFPSITSPAALKVTGGAKVSYNITSDIAATYQVNGLPAGLSLSGSTISGTAPNVNATYSAVLIATAINGAPSLRYLQIQVGTGGTVITPVVNTGGNGNVPGSFTAGPPSTAPGGILYDGDYTLAQLAGAPVSEVPFLPADNAIYVLKAPFWQFRENYAEPALGSPGPFGGSYVGTVKGSFKEIGGGIDEFWREYALVPATRNEFESFVYAFQIVGTVNGAAVNNIGEVPLTVQSRIQYDYYETNDPEHVIPLARAPRAVSVPLGDSSVVVFLYGWPSYGHEILAEDATYKVWKGNIYERRQRFIFNTDLSAGSV